MSSQHQTIKKISLELLLFLVFPAVLLLILIIPLLYLFLINDPFFYTNGWDEPTYLSLLGSCGLHLPGYFAPAYLACELNKLGIPGSHIAFYLDIFSLTILPAMIAIILNRLLHTGAASFLFAVLFLLSPILFNYGNPLIELIASPNYVDAFIRYGREPYQTILRSPNPQFSIILIAISILIFSFVRKPWILVLCVPLLYFNVAVAYSMLLFTLAAFYIANGRVKYPLAIAVALTLFLGWVCWLIISFKLIQTPIFETGRHHFHFNRDIKFPVYALVPILGIYLLHRNKTPINTGPYLLQVTFLTAIFLQSNIHLLSGISLTPKNWMDYGSSFVTSASIVALLSELQKRGIGAFNRTVGTLFVCVGLMTLASMGFLKQPIKHPFQLIMHRGLYPANEEILKRLIEAPELALTDNIHALAARVPFGVAGKVGPPLSYQYGFKFYLSNCPDMIDRNNLAEEWAKSTLTEKEYAKVFRYSERVVATGEAMSSAKGCIVSLEQGEFYTVTKPYRDNGWEYFTYSQAIKRILGFK